MSFESLKINRAAAISKLTAAADKIGSSTKSFADDRFWAPTVDKAGNGYAVFRFLPAAEGEDIPWVRYWDHGFKGPSGRWYIENSLTSIGLPDPLSEQNTKLWNSGREEDKDLVRTRKRRLHYVSNIFVVSDPGNPANEGKVFLFKYGKKIFDKIQDVMQPQFQDEAPVNPYDFWTGANFKLKIRQVEGYRNYDKSEFDKPSALFNADETRLKEVYDKLYELKTFIDPKTYKSYAELAAKLALVLGEDGNYGAESAEAVELPVPRPGKSLAPVQAASKATPSLVEPERPESLDDDGDDTLSYFAKLAKA